MRHLRAKAVAEMTGYSEQSIHALSKKGAFPAGLRRNGGSRGVIVWVEDEVVAWMTERARKRLAAVPPPESQAAKSTNAVKALFKRLNRLSAQIEADVELLNQRKNDLDYLIEDVAKVLPEHIRGFCAECGAPIFFTDAVVDGEESDLFHENCEEVLLDA